MVCYGFVENEKKTCKMYRPEVEFCITSFALVAWCT